MDVWKSIAGMLTVELTSAEPEQTLTACSASGIELFLLQRQGDLTYRFHIRRRDYRKAAALARKRGDSLRILEKNGVYWLAGRALHRPVLLFGAAMLLFLALYLPSRVLFVQVEGNSTVPSRLILEAAEDCGIGFGASRREVRSEKMKNALLSRVPELQWAGVNTRGCVATISVRERTLLQMPQQTGTVSNILASRDGYILSATVTSGTALFRVGQTVKEGQTLISGYTDCGICIRATRAEGEVFAQTNRNLTVVTPVSCTQRGAVLEEKRSVSLLLGKKRINLWKDSGIWDSSCGRMYKEYYLTLPGGFRLPVALCVQTRTVFETQSGALSQEDAEAALSGFAQRYVVAQMVAGQIWKSAQSVISYGGCYRLEGVYVCEEMIGRVQQEQIGDTNGKIS